MTDHARRHGHDSGGERKGLRFFPVAVSVGAWPGSPAGGARPGYHRRGRQGAPVVACLALAGWPGSPQLSHLARLAGRRIADRAAGVFSTCRRSPAFQGRPSARPEPGRPRISARAGHGRRRGRRRRCRCCRRPRYGRRRRPTRRPDADGHADVVAPPPSPPPGGSPAPTRMPTGCCCCRPRTPTRRAPYSSRATRSSFQVGYAFTDCTQISRRCFRSPARA